MEKTNKHFFNNIFLLINYKTLTKKVETKSYLNKKKPQADLCEEIKCKLIFIFHDKTYHKSEKKIKFDRYVINTYYF